MIYRGPNTAHGRGAPQVAVGNQQIDIWGQSNAIGRAARAEISSAPLSSDSGLATYNAGTFERVYIWTGSAYSQLTPTSNNGCDANEFGIEFGLAVQWMRQMESGKLYLNKSAVGGIAIAAFRANTSTYHAARLTADAWLSSNGVAISGRSLIWIQGESDAAQTQSYYQTELEGLIADRTTAGVHSVETKTLLEQMPITSAAYGAGVAAAKSAIAAASPTNTFAPSMPNYMQGDNLHQNGRGQVQAGYDAFRTIFGGPVINT